jgi:hypothetical protein
MYLAIAPKARVPHSMKKSGNILLGAIFLVAINACQEKKPDWITGYGDGKPTDTSFNGQHYRYYNNGWYPIYNGMICPGYYRRPFFFHEISSPGFYTEPPAGFSRGSGGVSTGGFGGSAHGDAGE